MARLETTLARALILYLALLPLFGLTAEVRGEPPSVPVPRPITPPPPSDPGPPPRPAEITFRPGGRPMTLRAFNGFRSDTTPGVFSHEDHIHPGGVATIDSPWGERLDVRYWVTPHGISFEYDQDLKVSYRFDEDGTLTEIFARTPEREALMEVGNRAELAYLGHRDFDSFDLSAYVLIDEGLRTKHSEAFVSGLAEFDAPAEASCATQGIQCIACIVTWGLSVAIIINACLVAGVPTMGIGCAAAILGHEVAGFTCSATCIAWSLDCFQPPDGGPVNQGCEF